MADRAGAQRTVEIASCSSPPLRDEGEAYASRLREAGVPVTTVRYDGITHDFMMLNPLSDTRATRAAVAQAIDTSRHVLQDH